MKSLSLHHDNISLPRLILNREEGVVTPTGFENHFLRDQTNQRFLLAANESGGIFLYDLSKWGLDTKHNLKQPQEDDYASYEAYSFPLDSTTSYSPIGHAQQSLAVIKRAQWHGNDALVFVTASSDGRAVVWDATALEPVLTMHPFPHRGGNAFQSTSQDRRIARNSELEEQFWPISSMDKNVHAPDQFVVGSSFDANAKLMDLRSATCSHSLPGHLRGCRTARWSPHSPFNVATGDGEGNIRIWDVRKAISCVCVLQRDETKGATRKSRSIRSNYAHLQRRSKKRPRSTLTQATLSHASHAGAIEQLAFDDHGQYLVSLSNKTLTVWDLLDRNPYVPRQFATITSATDNVTRPVVVTPNGRSDYIVWVGDKRVVKGFSLRNGGNPIHFLKGHFGTLMDICPWNRTELLTTARDHVILQWGHGKASTKPEESMLDVDNW
ncbi:hypothetical protein MPSEU_000532300 [Mayamaea pseudoterrestris]|nr:hypothetical protein MPSEU_000532300 [Mayamaea pseudoterrestris]